MSVVGLAADPVPNWNVMGTWALDFEVGGSHYLHTMVVNTFDRSTGDFLGTGTYNPDPVAYTWIVTGHVVGNAIDFHILYTGTGNPGYTADATGTITSDGLSMSGDWAGGAGTWTGAGTATLICREISDGVVQYSAGHYLAGTSLMTGYDAFGYNYQAHMFRGYYANAYLGRDKFPPYAGDTATYLAKNPTAELTWYWPYRDVWVQMKWNEPWLSNKDCDRDGALDRHFGSASYIGSGAWETNHQWSLRQADWKTGWGYFVKIVAPPTDATNDGVTWHAADGTAIGSVIWGEFAVTQEVYNDQSTGDHGLLYKSAHPGLGEWQ
jgi:hypothetical protein